MPQTETRIRPVILSGGSGTRLWPLSRSERPKQLLALNPPGTMLQATAARAADSRLFLPPIVVANAVHAEDIGAQLGATGTTPDALILEPEGRNTAPAIGLAAALQAQIDGAVPLLVMPSDQVIADVAAFHRAIAAALPVVREGWLATFGIRPLIPETGYGYIEVAEEIALGVNRVARFVEKPDRATAEAYLASGRFVWNGGIFLFRADAFLDALGQHMPVARDAVLSSIAGARRSGALVRPDPEAFARAPDESVDYAVMEKADRVAVTPVDMGWSDIGSWDALYDFAAKDGDGNCNAGAVIAIDTSNSMIRSEGPLIAAVGVSDLNIIATDDAVLITPRGASQNVKLAVEALKAARHGCLHRQVRLHEDWGHARRLASGPGLEVNELHVAPGQRSGARSGGGDTSLRVVEGAGGLADGPALSAAAFGLDDFATYRLENRGTQTLRVLEIVERGG
jgi:mannose-1-phosphate guanylyltransferase/mannose-1-phosphate guanylyltransferase/mannose-6-phosphate isomerase